MKKRPYQGVFFPDMTGYGAAIQDISAVVTGLHHIAAAADDSVSFHWRGKAYGPEALARIADEAMSALLKGATILRRLDREIAHAELLMEEAEIGDADPAVLLQRCSVYNALFNVRAEKPIADRTQLKWARYHLQRIERERKRGAGKRGQP